MGTPSTAGLLVPISLDPQLLIEQTLFTFFTKTSYLTEEVNCNEPIPSVSVPWFYSLFPACMNAMIMVNKISGNSYNSWNDFCLQTRQYHYFFPKTEKRSRLS